MSNRIQGQRLIPLNNQAEFVFQEVFQESVEFIRNYTLPFDMIGICTASEGENASVFRNLKTGEITVLKENDVFLIPYKLAMQYQHTLRNERYCIHFRLELFPGVDVFSGCDRIIVENSEDLRREAEAIFAIPDRILLLSRCQAFALNFCHRHWPEHYNMNAERIKPFEKVLQYIREHGNAATTVQELAKIKGCSPDHFTREFQHIFGTSPKAFLQREVFAKAARLLRSSAISIKETANKLNFSSEFYFSRFFKRISGISPDKWRNAE